MARIRSIKPEFWSDEKLAHQDPLTRLVFLSQGSGTPQGIDVVPGVGPKVTTFWQTFIQRPSWVHVFGNGIF